ncbi:SCO family protein [Fontisphaera persica]|uniref:SCO family protein n=1 Tax=Fontisphaera persica TaxID=2974023 RepID=UPI0024C014C7|nr:SCO family protein [Fontisphaera persica]WCJ58338.1 SCO family protein [Fontisphaera persica]
MQVAGKTATPPQRTPRAGGGTLYLGLTLLAITVVAVILLWFFRQRLQEASAARNAPLPVLGQVPPFTLTNQLGQVVTLNDLTGKVWVADIIFTRCAGPCPVMTLQMSELQPLWAAEPTVKLITLTTDPLYDTPEVLRAYGQKVKADPQRWWFLTGDKAEIARLAVQGLRLTAVPVPEAERANPADLFIHSTLFVVVDKHGRLRAVVETQEDDVEEGEAPRQGRSRWEREAKPHLQAIVRRLLEEP